MLEIALAGWIYLEACGFASADIEGYSYDVPKTMRAPNIRGFWVKRSAVIAVVDWRYMKGKTCSSIYAAGAPHSVHVIGTTEEILKKLRE